MSGIQENGNEEYAENVHETVLEEGVAEPMTDDDLQLSEDAEMQAIRAWMEPHVEPVVLAQLQAQGALTVDAIVTVEPEDLILMGLAKFKARGLVRRVREVWSRQGQDQGHVTDSQVS